MQYEKLSSSQAKIHGAFKIFFFHFYPVRQLFIFIHSIQNTILFQVMHSLSSLWKDIVVFLQFEKTCIIRLDMTFNRNTCKI